VTLEERVAAIESELDLLRHRIRGTLLALQEDIRETDLHSGPDGWNRRAWILALLNMLLAITLFVNVRFYSMDGLPPALSAETAVWLHRLWVALAFVWLVVQLYPLALLLEAEEKRRQQDAWRNALKLFVNTPSLALLLTLVVLVISVVSAFLPSLWLVAMAALAVCIGFAALRTELRHRDPGGRPE